jgi:hypothetical protein
MTCDGTPGSPGVETYPGEDGPEKLACLGCSVCKPWNYAPFRNTVDIPVEMQGQLEVEEAVRGLAWAKENPDAFKNAEGWVPCRQTARGPGCGHNTLEHTGPSSPNSDCGCCTWADNEGPLPHAKVVTEPKLWGKATHRQRDDLSVQASLYAEQTVIGGVTPAPDVQGVVDDLSGLHASLMDSMLGAMPNRAARRAMKHNRKPGVTGGNLPNRKRNR